MMKKKHFYAVILVVSFLLAGIQPALAIDIPTNTSVGTWDGSTYTLTTNVSEGLVIVQSNFTLDGNNKTVSWASGAQDYGVWMREKSGVTIKNLNVHNFHNGIWLDWSSDNILTGNTASNNNDHGICLTYLSDDNTLTDNTASNNNRYGIYLSFSSHNVLSRNTAESNILRGIYLKNYSNYNTIYNNNFIDNTTQAIVSDSTGNEFNLAATEGGGNYWSDWNPEDGPPYVFTGGQDNLPWTVKDGWLLNQPPIANAGPDQTVEQDSHAGASVTLDGSGSSDPDDDPLTYSWTWDGGSASGISPTVVLPLGTTTITLVVNDGTVDSEPDTVAITVEDTTPPIISCPGNTTIVGPDGVPVEDERIQTFLAGASADDDCDPSPVISHDAPTFFLPGDTVVTFTATDASGNTSDCESTVTVVEPAEAIELIIDVIAVIEGMDVPDDAEKEMDKAVKELNKAIDEFNKDRIDKAFDKIAKAVKELMKAQKDGADTQGVIYDLVALVQGIADEAIEDAIEMVGADNLHVVKAQEHYDKAFDKLADGKYDAAIKEFKKAYKEAMKALGE